MPAAGLAQLEELLATDCPFHREPADEGEMIRLNASSAALLSALLGTSVLCAADFSTYRGFELGTSMAEATKHPGVNPLQVRVVHNRPALIQELEWRPGAPYRADASKSDPVQEGLLRFYNGELFQIVSTYDRQKVEGMTEADMVDAISLTYGTATKPGGEIAYHSNYGETAALIARWESPEYSCDLIRTGDQASFVLILSMKSLDALAKAAILQANLLDLQEAPQRAIALRRMQDAESLLTLENARSINVTNFRP